MILDTSYLIALGKGDGEAYLDGTLDTQN